MSPLDLLIHLANFAAPALFLALLLVLAGRLVLGRSRIALWAQWAIGSVAGVAVLAGGLAWFGRDGMMATYAALVVVCGTVQSLFHGRGA
jgi:hypothetical protein